jgi:hypothetical protein
MGDPALNPCPPSEFSDRDSQKVAAIFAFFQKMGSKILCAETSSTERLAPQPELHELLAIPTDRRVPTYRKQRGMHVGSVAIKGKSSGREQAIVKQSGARPMAANHKHR